MIIYDFRNQNLIDFNQIQIGLFILVFGLVIYFLLAKYKPNLKQNWYTDFFGFSKDDIEEKKFLFPKVAKIMGLISIIFAGLFLIMQTKD